VTAVVLRGDARRLPLPDASVDLIVTSPPFWQLRSYTDGGRHYDGQLGSEPTLSEFLEGLWEVTTECARVLKPTGSIFVELGDSYTNKCLNDAPHRYVIGCVDKLGLIKRAEIVWHHVNGLPESVTDRARRAHSVMFHLVKQPRYYTAIDEIREPHEADSARRSLRYGGKPSNRLYAAGDRNDAARQTPMGLGGDNLNPLGKLPGSVWSIPSAPLTVPPHLGINHFAAYPCALVRPVVLGWSPPGICTACGEGRRPVVDRKPMPAAMKVIPGRSTTMLDARRGDAGRSNSGQEFNRWRAANPEVVTGYVCACTPYTDHPGTGEPNGQHGTHGNHVDGRYPDVGVSSPAGGTGHLGNRPRTGPWREYHHWTPPPTRPAVVLDPFCGTGTTMLVASVYGRIGIGVDLSMDYTRLARWRVHDPGERARAAGVPKPPPIPDGMAPLF
jgi:SAM-dependent methyltransferase